MSIDCEIARIHAEEGRLARNVRVVILKSKIRVLSESLFFMINYTEDPGSRSSREFISFYLIFL